MRAGLWQEWRRFTPLVAGLCTLVLVGLVVTELLPTGIAVYGLCFLGLGAALYTRPSARLIPAGERGGEAHPAG
ncbi:MAG: hypothetical protein M3350_00495 [Actinomycetota bacterium]|nr:hypothetical protein [Actinomycetota bacterium]